MGDSFLSKGGTFWATFSGCKDAGLFPPEVDEVHNSVTFTWDLDRAAWLTEERARWHRSGWRSDHLDVRREIRAL